MQNWHSWAVAQAAALFVCAALAPSAVQAAAQFSAEPLLLTLPADKRASSLSLGNKGSEPVTVQAELVSWSQDSGADVYTPAPELQVSPPIFSLKPDGQQVLRVGRLKSVAAPAREIAYRLKVAEVPAAGPLQKGALSTVMQLSFPIFVPPADRKAKALLAATAEASLVAGVTLRVMNSGAVHGKITGLRLLQNGAVVAELPLNFYVLAGASRTLAWPAPGLGTAQAGPAELHVQLEGRNRKQVVPVTVTP